MKKSWKDDVVGQLILPSSDLCHWWFALPLTEEETEWKGRWIAWILVISIFQRILIHGLMSSWCLAGSSAAGISSGTGIIKYLPEQAGWRGRVLPWEISGWCTTVGIGVLKFRGSFTSLRAGLTKPTKGSHSSFAAVWLCNHLLAPPEFKD